MSRARWMGATALGAFAAATYLGTTWGSTGGTAPAAAQRRARARAVVHDEPRDHDAGSERGRMAVARADGTAPSRLVHVPLGRPAALPANAPSANEILPEFQGLQVGDHVPDGTPETRGAGVAAHPGRDRARLAGARLPRRAVDRLRDGSEPPAWSSRARGTTAVRPRVDGGDRGAEVGLQSRTAVVRERRRTVLGLDRAERPDVARADDDG